MNFFSVSPIHDSDTIAPSTPRSLPELSDEIRSTIDVIRPRLSTRDNKTSIVNIEDSASLSDKPSKTEPINRAIQFGAKESPAIE